MEAFRPKARHFLKPHENHIAILKLKRNEPLTESDIEFLDLVIEHMTDRGVMDPRLLYESPFTDFDTHGVEGVFPPADVMRLVAVLREIEARTAA